MTNNERYEVDETDHENMPAIFWWFPNQEDFVPPPPTDETVMEKMDRISTTIKTSRNEISDILYSDINPEDKIIRSMEIQRESVHIAQLYKVKHEVLSIIAKRYLVTKRVK